MEQVSISDYQHRWQQLNHNRSSVQEMTLQNIQAQREAIRKRNIYLSLEMQRSGGTQLSDSYIKMVKNFTPNHAVQESIASYAKMIISKDNPWVDQPIQKVPVVDQRKLKQINKKFQHYQQQKKRRKKQTVQFKNDFERFQCTSPNKIRRQIPNHSKTQMIQSKSKLTYAQVKPDYQKIMVVKIFNLLQKGNQVKKADFLDYIIHKPQLLTLICQNEQIFKRDVIRYKTSNQGYFKLDQLISFFNQNQAVSNEQGGHSLQQQIRKNKLSKYNKDHDEQLMKKGCLLKRSDIQLLEQIFKTIDTHNDLVISRKNLIQKLRSDPRVEHLMQKAVVHQFKINKSIIFSRILQRIQVQGICKQQKHAKQFISLKQFMDHFYNIDSQYQTHIFQYPYVYIIQQLGNEDQNQIQLPKTALQLIQNTYNLCPSVGPYVRTFQFIQQLKRNSQYNQIKDIVGRRTSITYKLESQDFSQVIQRILKQGDQFMQLRQLLQFFSKKGRPIQFYNNQAKFQVKQDLKSQIRDYIKQIDGYDSDPQYNRKNIKKNKHKPQTKFIQTVESKFYDLAEEKIVTKQLRNVTIPQPFRFVSSAFTRQTRIHSQTKQQKYVFKAKQIPKQVKQIGLFSKLMQSKQDRKAQLRRQSMAITLAKQKPFSFYKRQKANKKTVQQREAYKFKANPVPWFCSVNLFKKMVQQQSLVRKEKISKMAHEGMTKSRLPPRMQKDQQLKKAKQLREGDEHARPQSSAAQFKKKQVPDFSKIHKCLNQSLQRKRNSKRPTQPVPFNFGQTKKISKLINLPQNNSSRVDIVQEARNNVHKQPKFKAGSTIKYEQAMKKTRRQRQQKQLARAAKEWHPPQPSKQIKDRVKGAITNIIDKDRNIQRVQQKRKQVKASQQNYKQKLKQIEQRVNQRSRLLDQDQKRNKQKKQQKRLYQMLKILKTNKVPQKYIGQYFTPDQKKKALDFQFLVKNGMIKDI